MFGSGWPDLAIFDNLNLVTLVRFRPTSYSWGGSFDMRWGDVINVNTYFLLNNVPTKCAGNYILSPLDSIFKSSTYYTTYFWFFLEVFHGLTFHECFHLAILLCLFFLYKKWGQSAITLEQNLKILKFWNWILVTSRWMSLSSWRRHLWRLIEISKFRLGRSLESNESIFGMFSLLCI